MAFATKPKRRRQTHSLEEKKMNSNNTNDAANKLIWNMRFAQLLDESDHKRCSEGNKTALLAETLEELRKNTAFLQQTDWMFQETKDCTRKNR
jgi:hypothetical protein